MGKQFENAVWNYDDTQRTTSIEPIWNALKEMLEQNEEVYCIETEDTCNVYTSEYEFNRVPKANQTKVGIQAVFDSFAKKGTGSICMNPDGKSYVITQDLWKEIQAYQPHSTIVLMKESVIKVHADAIVNAANTSLLGGGGVDGAMHAAAGPSLLAECRTLHGCKEGEAKITDAYNIKNALKIIHTVGPVYSSSQQEECERKLKDCYWNCLEVAHKNHLNSIAFCCISVGIFGYPLHAGTKLAIETVNTWLEQHSDVVMNVLFCCFKDEEYTAYQSILGKSMIKEG